MTTAIIRATELDDCVISVSVLRYVDGTRAIRLDLDQQAFEDKSYVDLSVADAVWLARTVESAASTASGE